MRIFLIATFFAASFNVNAAIDPKLKIMGTMCVYGTVGGFLLGTASLAFGGEERNVFTGASLGLYAGIAFGTYVILSHMAKKGNWGGSDNSGEYYPETSSPYEVQRWNASFDKQSVQPFKRKAPIFYMNVFKYRF